MDNFGAEIEETVRFHGNMTKEEYVSQTNKIVLQFCYRSATFSARNLQITYTVSGKYRTVKTENQKGVQPKGK